MYRKALSFYMSLRAKRSNLLFKWIGPLTELSHLAGDCFVVVSLLLATTSIL